MMKKCFLSLLILLITSLHHNVELYAEDISSLVSDLKDFAPERIVIENFDDVNVVADHWNITHALIVTESFDMERSFETAPDRKRVPCEYCSQNDSGYFHFKNDAHDEGYYQTVTMEQKGHWDFSKHHFHLWIKSIDAENTLKLNRTLYHAHYIECFLYFYSGSDYVKYSINWPLLTDEWQHIQIHRGNALRETGNTDPFHITVDWKNIDAIKFEWNAKDVHTQFELMVKKFEAVETSPCPLVTLRFDDGYQNVYRYARPKMDEYGYKGVWGINTQPGREIAGVGGTLDAPTNQGNNFDVIYTNSKTIKQMEEHGWDIASHSHNHASFGESQLDGIPDQTAFEMERNCILSKLILTAAGIIKGRGFLIWPYGGIETVRYNSFFPVKKHFALANATTPPSPAGLPLADRYFFSGKLGYHDSWTVPDNSTIFHSMKNGIDDLLAFNGWGILMFHNISAPGEHRNTSASPNLLGYEDFEKVIDYLNSTGCCVATFTDIFESLYPESPSIEVDSFIATSQRNTVLIEWSTQFEIDITGFNLYRKESTKVQYTRINDSLISAKGDASKGSLYEVIDEDLEGEKTYHYELETINDNGKSTLHGPVGVTLHCYECDVGDDGECTLMDSFFRLQKMLGICPTLFGECEDVCCDVTMDGKCLADDVLCTLQEHLGIHPNCLD